MFFGNAGERRPALRIAGDPPAAGRADPPLGPLVRRRFLEGSPRAAGRSDLTTSGRGSSAASTVVFVQPGGSGGSRGDDRCPAVALCGGAAGGPWPDLIRAGPRSARMRRPRFSRCCSTRQRPCTSSSFRGSTGTLIRPSCVRCARCLPEVRKLAPEARLPLVELAVPALRQMSPAQMREFLAGVKALVEADNKLTIFEYALQRLLLRHLVAYFVKRPSHPPRYTSDGAAGRADERRALGARREGVSRRPSGAAAFAAGVKALNWPGGTASSSRRRAPRI